MKRLPEYLKRNIIDTEKTKNVRGILKHNCLNTVCESARCPNKNECYQKNTATFLIMGNACTRNCRYCNIGCEKPLPLDTEEPKNLANAVSELGLQYAVITSVTRDDLPDGGAEHFAQTISAIRALTPSTKVEILTPDFKGDKTALDTIIEAHPDVFNHNIETVEALFSNVRPQGDYKRSLAVLNYIKTHSDIPVKSGLMVGLGENEVQIQKTFDDLKTAGTTILTVGQYIPPSKKHIAADKFYTLEEFKRIEELAKQAGFEHYHVAPLVRSSYKASELSSN